MKRRTKDNLITALGILMGLVGFALLLYPTVADWWNSRHMTEIVGAYDQAVTELDPREHDRLFAAAERFNVQMARFDHRLYLDDAERKAYYGLLDITGTGLMGYVGIPKMDVTIPIYHGTSEGVLRAGAGHLEGTSLPVGGKGTHSAITAHRGLPSARLFTDLNLLAVGDRFYITVLDRTLTYEVDQVRVVLPAEIDDLAIDSKRDYCTLVTCTPYGVNSHRLLVRGRRVDSGGDQLVVLAEAIRIEPRYVAPLLAVPFLFALYLWLALSSSYQTRHRKRAQETRSAFERRRRARRERSAGQAAAEPKAIAGVGGEGAGSEAAGEDEARDDGEAAGEDGAHDGARTRSEGE